MANTKKYHEFEKSLKEICDKDDVGQEFRGEVSTIMAQALSTLAPHEYYKLCTFLSNY